MQKSPHSILRFACSASLTFIPLYPTALLTPLEYARRDNTLLTPLLRKPLPLRGYGVMLRKPLGGKEYARRNHDCTLFTLIPFQGRERGKALLCLPFGGMFPRSIQSANLSPASPKPLVSALGATITPLLCKPVGVTRAGCLPYTKCRHVKCVISFKSFKFSHIKKSVNQICQALLFWRLPILYSCFVSKPTRIKRYSLIQSPHVHKKSRLQLDFTKNKGELIVHFSKLTHALFLLFWLQNSQFPGVQLMITLNEFTGFTVDYNTAIKYK